MSEMLIKHNNVFCQHSFTVGRSVGREAVGRSVPVQFSYLGRGKVLEVGA